MAIRHGDVPIESDPPSIETLLGQLTLHEKVTMLAGSDMWHSTAVERLGIPAFKMTDGPNGVRGEARDNGGGTSACFPAGIALAATWNLDIVGRVARALGQEAKAKGAHVLLAPTVNIHRSPLNGRNFECYSEDPYLTARMAVAYIEGVQSEGVSATVKHFVGNDSEYERFTMSSDIGQRALREIYLPPFRAAVLEAGTWALMSSYNRVNGTYASENPETLGILKGEWNFEGAVISDWFNGTNSTAAAANAGLDLEMPGPTRWRGLQLQNAVERGLVSEATIDAAVRRLLRLMARTGALDQKEAVAEQSIDRPEHRAIAREAADEAIVLLKNEGGVLPLQSGAVRTIAVIGPNAKEARIMGGGSATVNAHYAITPFDGITERAGSDYTIGYEPGTTLHNLLPKADMTLFRPASEADAHGLRVEYFNSGDLSGEVVATATATTGELGWLQRPPEAVSRQGYSLRLSGVFVPQETGTYTFALTSAGLSRLLLNGTESIDNWTQQKPGTAFMGMGSEEVRRTVDVVAGQEYPISVEFATGPAQMPALRLGLLPPFPADALERAARLAAESDVALVFVGTSGEWESESFDRPNLALPGQQDELVARVAAANKNTVVVLNTGSPIAMPWLADVAAVVQAWFPGQECGHAIADVLFGDVNPSGKLSQTFPARLQDNPAYLNYPGENGHVLYGEGIFVGYRYYEKKDIAPLFPFGFGLSYTTFDYSPASVSAAQIGPDDTLQVTVEVTNTGSRAGQEVVQLYIHDVASRLVRPEKELKGFAKVKLEPGQSANVTFTLTRESLAYYDDLAKTWVAEAGDFEALVAASSQDIRSRASFTLTQTARWNS